MHFGEDAADARHNTPSGYATMREAANAKPLQVVQKEFEIVLKDGEQLNQVVHDLFVRAECKIPSNAPLFWRQSGDINGHPVVLAQGPPGRLAYFEELLNEKDRLQRDGWLVWENHDEKREVSRIRWIRPAQHPSPGPCGAHGCGTEKAPRWALVYLVEEIGHEKPTTGVVVVYCQTCAVPKDAQFIEEEA